MVRKTIQCVFNDALENNIDIIEHLEEHHNTLEATKEYAWHSSHMFKMDAVIDAIERFYSSNYQWVTKDQIALWFVSFDDAHVPEHLCKNVTRALLWMLFTGMIQATKNHIRYIGLKIINQRLYEIDQNISLVPDYVYKYLSLLHYAFIRVYYRKM